MKLFPVIIFLLLGFAIYSNTFNSPFIFDDVLNITNNDSIRNFSDFFSDFHFKKFRFIGYLTFSLNYQIHELDLFGYHLINILIHIFNSILVWIFVKITFLTPVLKNKEISKHKNSIALFTALIFLSHPIQTQAVTYVIQRLASLATLFYLSSLVFYVKARLGDSRRIIYFAAAISTFFLGIYTKETVVTLPVVVLLYEAFFFSGNIFKKKHVVFVSLILFFIITWFVHIRLNSPEIFAPKRTVLGEIVNSKNYLITQPKVITKYVQLFFYPVNQNLDYYFPLTNNILETRVLINILLIISILIIAIILFKKYRLVSFSMIWFFVTLSIESSFIPLEDVIFEHRLYLPSVGLSLFSVCILYYLTNKSFKKISVMLLIIIISVLGILTYSRNSVYSSKISIWSDTVKKAPLNPRAVNSLGKAYFEIKQPEIAEIFLRESVELNPNYEYALSNYGAILIENGKDELARKYLARAIQLHPKFALARINMGLLELKQKNYSESLGHFLEVIMINPNSSQAYEKLGLIYIELGDFDQAKKMFENALKIQPDLSLSKDNLDELEKVSSGFEI